jgi:hypothetical protein
MKQQQDDHHAVTRTSRSSSSSSSQQQLRLQERPAMQTCQTRLLLQAPVQAQLQALLSVAAAPLLLLLLAGMLLPT